jgi:hypothetical protein
MKIILIFFALYAYVVITQLMVLLYLCGTEKPTLKAYLGIVIGWPVIPLGWLIYTATRPVDRSLETIFRLSLKHFGKNVEYKPKM